MNIKEILHKIPDNKKCPVCGIEVFISLSVYSGKVIFCDHYPRIFNDNLKSKKHFYLGEDCENLFYIYNSIIDNIEFTYIETFKDAQHLNNSFILFNHQFIDYNYVFFNRFKIKNYIDVKLNFDNTDGRLLDLESIEKIKTLYLFR